MDLERCHFSQFWFSKCYNYDNRDNSTFTWGVGRLGGFGGAKVSLMNIEPNDITKEVQA